MNDCEIIISSEAYKYAGSCTIMSVKININPEKKTMIKNKHWRNLLFPVFEADSKRKGLANEARWTGEN